MDAGHHLAASAALHAAFVARCVVLFKGSSLGSVIGYEEVLRRSQETGTFTSTPTAAVSGRRLH
jgi:ABC-type amino acid transport system permease subunit